MRRMATTKQLDYVNDLHEVAEKGFKVGTYPSSFDNADGILNLKYCLELWLSNNDVDFENHVVTAGAYFEFEFPDLLIHYGLGEGGFVGYIDLYSDENFEFPETINDAQSLKQYLESLAGIQELANFLDNTTLSEDEVMIYNDVAAYRYNEFNAISYTPDLVIHCYTILEADWGAGKEIIDASDPVGTDTLDVENLRVENAEIGNLNSLSIGGIPIYGGTIENMTIKDYNIVIKPVSYLTAFSDLKQQGYASYGLAFISHVQGSVGTAYTALNTDQPQTLQLVPMIIGENEDVYCITNTKLTIGQNVYIFDSDEEAWALQGTYQSVSFSSPVTLQQNNIGYLTVYNS